MATDMSSKIGEFSREERKLVVQALTLLGASVRRSINSERSDEVKALREKAMQAINALSLRFQ